jgi:hypothetical protein
VSIRAQANRIGTDRARYVFERLLAKISEIDMDLAANLIVGGRRDAETTWFSYPLKPRCDIDAIPRNVVTSIRMSPRLTPIRNSIRRSCGIPSFL